jgi:general secretion pathway protein H
LRQRRALHGSRGFTLLELLIVSALVVAIAFVVIPAAQSALGVRTREATSKVAGSIRAMYGEAVLQGATCRLVFDLDEGAYWPECAQGRVRVASKEESVRGARVEPRSRDFPGTEEEAQAREEIAAKTSFSAHEGQLAKRQSLPEGVHFGSVWTQHQAEPYTSGTSYLYFFPHGQTQKAFIHVERNEDDIFTVVVDPVTGRTRVLPQKVDVPAKELRR